MIEDRMRAALVLRPEPGNAQTATRLAAVGIDVLRQPLFAIAPVDWLCPDPERYDAVLLTSANAARHAVAGSTSLRLPAVAVGEATAAAAREAGFVVAMSGDQDAAALVLRAREHGFVRLLHLAGRDRIELPGVEAVVVYRSNTVPIAQGAACIWARHVALLHSVRAARQFGALVERDGVARRTIAIAALSDAVMVAAGTGWATGVVAHRPTDAALVARVLPLIDPLHRHVDK